MIARDPAYISHGEIQTGLAADAQHWSPDLPALYESDFLQLGDGRDLLVARADRDALVGIAILAWEATPRRAFAVLEDMAVDPEARSAGVGAQMLAEIETRVRERGIGWLFLESGRDNHGAHRFFERHGFNTLSHVFGKRV